MNKESQHEGWLIKSPPTKRIWRARWRRRWFTLKQGEIPEQFCLEYYTDRNCRKLKGVIDLDQCEQVDCGLRLENRKQKFQFMFDIKTPKRTYYLAADTEADMRDWVNCICQVCHLHDTKQSNELTPDENRAPSNSTNNTTTTSLGSSGPPAAAASGAAMQSFNAELLRRPAAAAAVVDQQPPLSATDSRNNGGGGGSSDCAYVNTSDYSNRETLLCDMRFQQAAPPPSPGAAVYLNSTIFQAVAAAAAETSARLAVSANGVVRRLPENLVLNNTPLAEAQQQSSSATSQSLASAQSVQPSPALSTASGPYIPISECYSGSSPKYMLDNPSTPLNNLDPKFYDTPRSHSNNHNIGLNLTNDQSYSPKITNCGLHGAHHHQQQQQQQHGEAASTPNNNKSQRSHRSDSDSESVFTDDEWAHPLPLREHVDRSTRPSDSSIENESFVVTFSQRFSKMTDDEPATATSPAATAPATRATRAPTGSLDRLAKVLKNKNNLILDFKDATAMEKTPCDLPQFSDTENTSPAIGPRDANSVVLEESYDIPRSHQLPSYHNVAHLQHQHHHRHGKQQQVHAAAISPEANPIAASTPNLLPDLLAGGAGSPASPAYVTTMPRAHSHCYTNAGPVKLMMEGTVFRYDFNEQGELPPVNRQLKPKVSAADDKDKPPEEVAAKPPLATPTTQEAATVVVDALASKFKAIRLQMAAAAAVAESAASPALKPPSVDRKLKPNAYRIGNSATLGAASSPRRSGGAPLSMVLLPQSDGGGGCSAESPSAYVLETHTLPRQPRPTNYALGAPTVLQLQQQSAHATRSPGGLNIQHQRTASAAAAIHLPPSSQTLEHKLQYFDLDVANAPAINRQSMSVGNLHAHSIAGSGGGGGGVGGGGSGGGGGISGSAAGARPGLSADPSARVPVKSSVVYNSVDFVKTEAFKRIREERKKESEGANTSSSVGAGGTGSTK